MKIQLSVVLVATLRPIALADEPVETLCGGRGLMYLNGKAGVIDDLWKNGSAASAYWLWEKHGRVRWSLPIF